VKRGRGIEWRACFLSFCAVISFSTGCDCTMYN
jgi:hypothetical protein